MSRRRRNETVIWIVLLMLQECQLVLLANLQEMKKHSQDSLGHIDSINNMIDDKQRVKRNNKDSANIVIQKVAQAGDLYKSRDDQWQHHVGAGLERLFHSTDDSDDNGFNESRLLSSGRKLHMPKKSSISECDLIEERKAREAWSDNEGLVLPLYLSTASILSYLKGCNELMKDQVTNLVDVVGFNESLEYIGYAEELMTAEPDDDDDDDDDDDADDDDDSPLDPEGDESSKLNEATYLISRNIEATSLLSDTFLSFNGSALRTFDGMDKVLDDTINQYLVMTSMLETDNKTRRKRRAVFDENVYKVNIQMLQKHAIDKYSEYEKQLKDNQMERFKKKLRGKRKPNYERNTRLKSNHLKNLKLGTRKRRESDLKNDTLTVFIKNSKYDCLLLTFQGRKLSFQKFDELAVTSQLWILSKDRIQHYESGLFLSQSWSEIFLFNEEFRPQSFLQINGDMMESEEGCPVKTRDDREDLILQSSCGNLQDSTEKWSYVTFENAQNNLGTIVCMFVIQKVESCTVLTYSNGSPEMRLLNEENIENQLWYWDNEYIRNARTNKYLTSSWINSPLEVTDLHTDINQRWTLKNESLYAKDIKENIVLVLNSERIIVGRKGDSDKGDYEIRLVTLNAYKNSTCNYGNEYFIIKHEDFPCLVLCTEQEQAEPALGTKLLVIGVTVCLSIPSALFFLIFFEPLQAVIAGVAVGIILASVAAFTIQYAEAFKIVYDGANFRTFNETDSEICLWYQYDGGIKNAKNAKYLSLNNMGANKFKSIILEDDADKRFLLNNRVIQERQERCELSVRLNATDITNPSDKLPVTCINDRENGGRWKKILVSETSNLIEQTSCLYFLRQTSNVGDSCDVLTVETNSTETKLTSKMPSSLTLFEQLWYLEGNKYFNLRSGETVNISEVESTMSPIAFTNDSAKSGFMAGCEKEMFFIKSKRNPCLLLTHRNLSSRVELEEFDKMNFLNQLWVYENDKVINVATGISDSIGNINMFERVKFEEDFNSYASKILCPFFLQELKEPCGLLTVDINTGYTFDGPLTSDLIEKQLWYKSGETLLHLETGRMLILANGTSPQLAPLDIKIPVTEFSIRENNGIIHNRRSSHSSFSWKRLNSATLFKDTSIINCNAYNRSYFFIKTREDPCVLLTSRNLNETPYFDVFEENNIQQQLWYTEYSHLINMKTGLVLALDPMSNEYIMRENMYYDVLQNLEILNSNGDFKSISNGKRNCILKTIMIKGEKVLVCKEDENLFGYWEIIPYDALEDISKLMCLYYIRSLSKPCEFVTGYGESTELKIRPLTEQLIQKQLFYTKGNAIIHQKTGLYLTATHKSVVLSGKVYQRKQAWEMNKKYISLKNNSSKLLTYDDNDGVVGFKSEKGEGSSVTWSKISLDYDFGKDGVDYPHCSVSQDVSSLSVFFITSTTQKCVVLTARGLGDEPIFQAYDEDKHEHQLWYYHNGHVLNLGTGLALMVQEEQHTNGYDVLLWNKYSFSKAQRFDVKVILSRIKWKKNNCKLATFKTETGLTLVCKSNGVSDLNIIPFDEGGTYYDKITCLFFMKSLKTPCELLTVVNNDIKIRPISGDLLNSQLWSWKDKQIVNHDTNKMLCIVHKGGNLYIELVDNASARYVWECNWVYERGFLKSVRLRWSETVVIGIETAGGFITVQRLSYYKNDVQQWVLTSKNDGIRLATENKFHCKGYEDSTMYVIRSEYDDCPLLKSIGEDWVGYKTVEDSGKGIDKTVWWTRHENHVCSAALQKCLAVSGSHSLKLETRYSFEKQQKWSLVQENIRYLYGSQKVTYTGSQITLTSHHTDSDKKKWKWFSSGQIERDSKHLRCSRCYNKGEETAAEIISYIPIISLFYNIGRSIAYGVKNCPKVALGALVDSLIDLAMDAIMVLSAGSASAFALGIKTAIKFGFKAGLKAFANGIKSMIKVAIKSIRKGIVNFVKTGFRRSLKQQLVKMKLNLKAVVSGLKKVPGTLKTFTKSGLSNFKRFVKQSFKSMNSLHKATKSNWKAGLKGVGLKMVRTLKKMPETVKSQLKKFGTSFKRKMKTLNDKLAKKAENAIKKADELKTPKKIRCRRGIGFCAATVGELPSDRMKLMADYRNGNLKVPELPTELKDDFVTIKAIVPAKDTTGQYASIGLKQADEFKFDDYAKISENELKDKTDNFVPSANQHTEPFLLENIETQIQKTCSQQKPCDVVLFTKLSPCHDRKDGMETCLSQITNKCKHWLEKFGTRCLVGFEKYYKTSSPFADWNSVLRDALKNAKFPTKAGGKFDDILANSELMDTISSVIKSDFDDIFREDMILKKVDIFFPGGNTPDFNQFYKSLKDKTDDVITNRLNNDGSIKVLTSSSDEVKKFYDELLGSMHDSKSMLKIKADFLAKTTRDAQTNAENLFGGSIKVLTSSSDEFKKFYDELLGSMHDSKRLLKIKADFLAKATRDAKRNAGTLFGKVQTKVKEVQKEAEDLVNKVAVQMEVKLNRVAGEAQVTNLLNEAVQNSGDAVKVFHLSDVGTSLSNVDLAG